ncbi:hypothetical protein [Kitasatospora sp. NPDC017646]|uniref:hypothetical protein n=1 Tax=Kitasatospora sp. NPDC017646 TaxID=3364024 RepID=UPI0037931C59
MSSAFYDAPATVYAQGVEIPVHADLTGERPEDSGQESWGGTLLADELDEYFAAVMHTRSDRLLLTGGRDFDARGNKGVGDGVLLVLGPPAPVRLRGTGPAAVDRAPARPRGAQRGAALAAPRRVPLRLISSRVDSRLDLDSSRVDSRADPDSSRVVFRFRDRESIRPPGQRGAAGGVRPTAAPAPAGPATPFPVPVEVSSKSMAGPSADNPRRPHAAPHRRRSSSPAAGCRSDIRQGSRRTPTAWQRGDLGGRQDQRDLGVESSPARFHEKPRRLARAAGQLAAPHSPARLWQPR